MYELAALFAALIVRGGGIPRLRKALESYLAAPPQGAGTVQPDGRRARAGTATCSQASPTMQNPPMVELLGLLDKRGASGMKVLDKLVALGIVRATDGSFPYDYEVVEGAKPLPYSSWDEYFESVS